MDTDQTTRIEIDLTDTDKTWIDGHGDAISISSDHWSTLNLDATASSAYPYTISTTSNGLNWPNTSPSWTFSDLSITSPRQAKIELQGDDADIEINGESVVGMLREIRDRLNILQVSEEMEQ